MTTVPDQHSKTSFLARFMARKGMPVFGLMLAALLLTFSFTAPAQAQIFDDDGNSGSVWIKMFRGNGPDADCTRPGMCEHVGLFPDNYYGISGWIADPHASSTFSAALRLALGVYSNALLIVASIILLYHLLIMVTETAHQGVVGGKRANQIWAPIRLVIAIGLLVPLSGSLNSSQYIMLQVVEWGSNMATKVWSTFLANAGEGTGSDPTPHMPDTGSIGREAAKIGACMHLINNSVEKSKGDPKEMIAPRIKGLLPMAILYGNEKHEALCGSVIIFAGGMGAAAGYGGISAIVDSMEEPAKHFMPGNAQYNQDPGQPPEMALAFALGTLESVSGGWNNSGGSSGAGWVSAGSWFLSLAAGGSNRVSGTDTLPIVMGPQAEKIRPQKVQQAFYGMAEWIVGKYKKHASGGVADADMLGNTVAGRKFVDLMMMFLDQFGVVSGLWSPGSIAFDINLGNSPLAELVDLGHRMIRTALDFFGAAVELGVNEPQHAMYSALFKAKSPDSVTAKSGQFFATMAIPILAAAGSTLLMMGCTFGIFMPLLPFTKFVLSVLTWILSVLEALACVPLLALAWLTPYGEGFAGQKVESGYWLIIHAFLRPVMTIFGLVASMLMFNIAAYLVTEFYRAIASNVGTFTGAMFVVTKLAFGWMYVSILYACLNACLKAMDAVGKNAVTWMGGRAHEENMGDGQSAVSMAKEGTQMLASGLQGMAYASQSAGASSRIGAHGPGDGDPTKKKPPPISDAGRQQKLGANFDTGNTETRQVAAQIPGGFPAAFGAVTTPQGNAPNAPNASAPGSNGFGESERGQLADAGRNAQIALAQAGDALGRPSGGAPRGTG